MPPHDLGTASVRLNVDVNAKNVPVSVEAVPPWLCFMLFRATGSPPDKLSLRASADAANNAALEPAGGHEHDLADHHHEQRRESTLPTGGMRF